MLTKTLGYSLFEHSSELIRTRFIVYSHMVHSLFARQVFKVTTYAHP